MVRHDNSRDDGIAVAGTSMPEVTMATGTVAILVLCQLSIIGKIRLQPLGYFIVLKMATMSLSAYPTAPVSPYGDINRRSNFESLTLMYGTLMHLSVATRNLMETSGLNRPLAEKTPSTNS